jgi:hypothetical protein
MKRLQLSLALLAVGLAAIIATRSPVLGLLLLTLFSCAVNIPTAQLRAVTLSVPEILMDILDAFKLELPEIFGPDGFATDFSTGTAHLGDKITAHISHVPVSAAYDSSGPGYPHGFYAGAQAVETLIEDVPVYLNQFRHVPVKVAWLTQLSAKKNLYAAAVKNYAYALAKYILDQILVQSFGNFSNSVLAAPAGASLDSFEAIRSQCNSQKLLDKGRWMIANTPLAAALANDDRTRSELFYGQLNGDKGYREWRNLAGFKWIKEYPDVTADIGPYIALCGDRRAICLAVRRPDFSNAADELGVPKIMDFYPIEDPETKLPLLGVAWQEVGTGDVYVSAAILFGVGAGNQGGAPGSITDNAGLLIRSS